MFGFQEVKPDKRQAVIYLKSGKSIDVEVNFDYEPSGAISFTEKTLLHFTNKNIVYYIQGSNVDYIKIIK